VRLVVGLGNPGAEYQGNRHNAGFMVAERLRARGAMGRWEKKFSGQLAKGRIEDVDVVVLQPLTYMNLSGRSVQRTAAFFQVTPAETVVVHDDLDLPFGTVRVKQAGGTGGHKGLKSIHETLGTDAYPRVRIGIGRPAVGSAEDWVLQDFSADERIDLDRVLGRAEEAVVRVLTRGVSVAMNEFNERGKAPTAQDKAD
jgi:PTH1 family peptidyl-tRNA hydrolase